jgi:hypothetical protein
MISMNGAGLKPTDGQMRQRPWGPLLASLALIASLAAPASAQINPYAQTGSAGGDNDDDPLRAPSAVPGLTGYSRGLALTASIASRYEDNLLRQAVKDDGIRVRPSVSANYGLGLGRGGLFVQGNYGRDMIYGSRRVAASERMMIGGGLDFNLSRCTGQIGGSHNAVLAGRSASTVRCCVRIRRLARMPTDQRHRHSIRNAGAIRPASGSAIPPWGSSTWAVRFRIRPCRAAGS